MSTRWTALDVVKVSERLASQIANPLEQPKGFEKVDKRVSKWRNQPVSWQGEKFRSIHELEVYKEFLLEKLAGKIRAVIREVSIRLPGCDRRMRIDFLIVDNDGRQRWVDAKGAITKEWALKSDQVFQAYGITISTV